MKKVICLIVASVLFLTGCGGSKSKETETPATEPAATIESVTEPTTEPTTVSTEPKTFFEEQGFVFWEGLNVHETLDDAGNPDGGIFAEGNILNSSECKITIKTGNREETTYRLADTKAEITIEDYSLIEFDEVCKEKSLATKNIPNPSDSLYKAFAKEDSGITKETWLEQFRDYKIVHCKNNRLIRVANEVRAAKYNMNIGQNRWRCEYNTIYWNMSVMNCMDGTVYEPKVDIYPGEVNTFLLAGKPGKEIMAAVADIDSVWQDSGVASDLRIVENFFIMVPVDFNDLSFIIPVADKERSLEDYERDVTVYSEEIIENAWKEGTCSEYMNRYENWKYYFLSPNHC